MQMLLCHWLELPQFVPIVTLKTFVRFTLFRKDDVHSMLYVRERTVELFFINTLLRLRDMSVRNFILIPNYTMYV